MNAARTFSDLIRVHPYASTVAAALGRGFVGDSLAQAARPTEDASGAAAWDARRCATYMLFTTGVAFAIDKYVYSHVFARWWPAAVGGRTSYLNAAKANAADNFVVTPLAYFPAFYVFKDCVMEARPGGPAAALRHYGADAGTQLPLTWAFWAPANVLIFTSPPYLRVVLVSGIGTAYITMLSLATHWLDASTLGNLSIH